MDHGGMDHGGMDHGGGGGSLMQCMGSMQMLWNGEYSDAHGRRCLQYADDPKRRSRLQRHLHRTSRYIQLHVFYSRQPRTDQHLNMLNQHSESTTLRPSYFICSSSSASPFCMSIPACCLASWNVAFDLPDHYEVGAVAMMAQEILCSETGLLLP